MNKIVLVLISLLVTVNVSFSQIEMEEMEIEESESPVTETLVKQYKLNEKYKTEKINEHFSYFYLKSASYSNRKYGLLKDGKEILPAIFKKYYVSGNNNKIILGINRLYGLYNLEKEDWDITMQYASLNLLKGDLFIASNDAYKYGVVDSKNNIIIPFEWIDISRIYNVDNYIKVKKNFNGNRKYGIYNIITRKLVIPCEYSSISPINASNDFLVGKNNRFNIVDINNNIKFKNWYQTLVMPRNGRRYYIVKLNDKMGIIDENEKIIVPIEYKKINTYPYNDGSYLAENSEGKFGCLAIDGRVTLPFVYTNITSNSNSNVLATKDNKCGVIRINDGIPYELATCNYDSVVTSRSFFIVKKDNKYGLLDLYGKALTETIYDNISLAKYGRYGNKNIAIAKKGKSYFLLSNMGKILNETPYSLIKELKKIDYSRAVSYLIIKNKKSKCGLIDILGKEAVPTIFDDILLYTNDNNLLVKIKNKVGVYSIYRKKQIIPAEYDQIIPDTNSKFIGVKGKRYFQIDLNNNTVKELGSIKK